MDSESRVHPDPASGHVWDEMQLHGDGFTKRKSCVGILERDRQPEQEESCQDSSRAVTEQLRFRCLRLGMTSEALDGWAQYHIRPAVAMIYHHSAQILLLGTTGYLLTGAPFSRLYYSIPYICGILHHIGIVAAAWRLGANLTLNPVVHRTYPGAAPPSLLSR